MDITGLVPLLIVLGAIGIPFLVYLALGLGEAVLSLCPPGPQRAMRPWLWLLLPLGLVALILIYPVIVTVATSFQDARAESWIGAANYRWAFSGAMLDVIGNNILWLVIFPVVTLVLALIAAVLFDKVSYEPLAMTIVILPTAISFTAGAVIWTQMYSFQPAGSPQLGTFNAVLQVFGLGPVPWLIQPVVNTLALIFVAVWLQIGIAVLILSSAIKNVGTEMIEAARLDGAGEWRIFFSMILPNILPSVLVVLTTMIIAALKVFDIVYVMTNGNFGTDVIANRLYYELFAANNLGHASAIAVILLISALPVALINIIQFRTEVRP
ncbi:ABC-type sugar transport system, permease component [Rubellimicrobium thermophilum DSM 16684]|uniref:ABC-type sugar transport system, permease component n=1 Tax=Rubellimicrobium thermophilum DSM 16684 TaxID=1123069 RepID=S9S865_9RHOB|nr:sugar ABC transporter permease [Rubellimicrobium thermophilum]EPX82439.1 ABC-type sugar transport system, permease component [Rubellimicrobium thermophilum DSM 16684]